MLRDKVKKRQFITETVPEWEDAVVSIRRLSAGQRLALIESFEGAERDAEGKLVNTSDAIAWCSELLALSLHNDAGEAEFDCEEGRELLASEDFGLIQRLSDLAMDINGIAKPKAAIDAQDGDEEGTKKN